MSKYSDHFLKLHLRVKQGGKSPEIRSITVA